MEEVKFHLETERLILREFRLNDARDLYELNADAEVMKYTGDTAFSSVEEAEKFVLSYDHYHRYGYGRWSVLLKSDQSFLGWCGLKFHDGEPVDVGYRFKKSAWNRGYATESASRCLEYGFKTLGLDQIMARIHPSNKASIAVAKKLGMVYWKMGPCDLVEDTAYYLIDRKTYINQE